MMGPALASAGQCLQSSRAPRGPQNCLIWKLKRNVIGVYILTALARAGNLRVAVGIKNAGFADALAAL